MIACWPQDRANGERSPSSGGCSLVITAEVTDYGESIEEKRPRQTGSTCMHAVLPFPVSLFTVMHTWLWLLPPFQDRNHRRPRTPGRPGRQPACLVVPVPVAARVLDDPTSRGGIASLGCCRSLRPN
ncbi:hypothetical protein PVAP13_6NG063500 [Panicum virgatum]|uniref:Uncharacterized protein n=1 Tax=Panicum virgatum TaxID=38727 RepID=A0A8T0QUS4_PANVG|nr:hypothetical protein PVAP13_6NG063500 [Panicum virgatum]